MNNSVCYVLKTTRIFDKFDNIIDQDSICLYFIDENIAKENVKKDIDELQKSKYLSNCECPEINDNIAILKSNLYGQDDLIFQADYEIIPINNLITDVDVFPDTSELLNSGTYKDQKEEDLLPYSKQFTRDKINELAELSKQLIQLGSCCDTEIY